MSPRLPVVELKEGAIPESLPAGCAGKRDGRGPSASPCSENSWALSKTWLQLCSSNTGLGFISIFIVLDDFGVCCPARSLQGALSSLGRERAGAALLPFLEPGQRGGRDLLLPAQHCWHLERLFLVGWRALASSRRDPGAFPCAVLSWDPQLLEQPPESSLLWDQHC